MEPNICSIIRLWGDANQVNNQPQEIRICSVLRDKTRYYHCTEYCVLRTALYLRRRAEAFDG
jgi:hypothetical protein